jgi:hypothetical protein
MDYTNNSNKYLLWELLQDSGIFNNMQNNKYNKIQEIFENTINNINIQYSNLDLTEKNKKTIEVLIPIINNEKNAPQEAPLTVIYKADDLRKEREETLNNKMKEQQKMFDNTMNPSRPSDINFSDNNVDKPLGSEMDRMIASMMAEREQELEIPEQNVSQAAKWINNDNPDNVSIETRKDKANIVNNNRDNTNKEKKVSFKDTNNDTNNDIVTNILDKLKTKTNTQSTIEVNTIDNAMSENIKTSTSTNTKTLTIESRLDKLENMLYDFTNCQKNIEKMCVKILELHSTKNT